VGATVSKTIRFEEAIDQAVKAAAFASRRSFVGQLEWCVIEALGLDAQALALPVERVTKADAVASWDRIVSEISESRRTGQALTLSPRERAALRSVGGTARIGQTRPSQLLTLRRSYTRAFLAWSGGTTDGKANT